MGMDALCTNAIEMTLVSSSLAGGQRKGWSNGVSVTARTICMARDRVR